MSRFSSALTAAAMMLALGSAEAVADLCVLVEKARNDVAAKWRQMEAEKNPLKKHALLQEYEQMYQQAYASIDKFFKANHMKINDHTGTVYGIAYTNYMEGPGVDLTIRLPCRVSISFLFLDPHTDYRVRYSKMDNWAPLYQWRKILETIVANDTVVFSSRFHFTFPYHNYPRGGLTSDLVKGLEFGGVMMELKKK